MKTEEEILEYIEYNKEEIHDLKQLQIGSVSLEAHMHYQRIIDSHMDVIHTLEWVLK